MTEKFLSVAAMCWLCIAACARGQVSPLEAYFFEDVQFVEKVLWNDLNATGLATVNAFLDAAFAVASDGTGITALEMRVLTPLTPGTAANDPLSSDAAAAVVFWPSVVSYLERPGELDFTSLASAFNATQEWFQVISDTGGCHYCPDSAEFTEGVSSPVMAHFSNRQSIGKYPIRATFTHYLSTQTQNEVDTLDYTAVNVITEAPNATVITYDFDFVDFLEFYKDPAAFDIHVANVNDTLRPNSANWFTDLGNVRTEWFSVRNYTNGCYKCSSPSDGGESASSSVHWFLNHKNWLIE